MPNDRHDILKSLLKVVNTTAAQENFGKVVKQVLELFSHMKADIQGERASLRQEVTAATSQIDQRLAAVKDGTPGRDGRDGRNGRDGVNGRDGAPGPKGDKGDPGDIKDLSPQEIRNELELLQGDERLDKSAVKGLDKLETTLKEIAARPSTSTMTPSGPMLYVGGSKKGRAQTINLIAGTGISLSYAYASGRNDITISATGTVALTPITVTGTIDNSNTSFTAASTPSLVVINGASYRDGKGVTISGLNITTDNPVGTGGDIYAL